MRSEFRSAMFFKILVLSMFMFGFVNLLKSSKHPFKLFSGSYSTLVRSGLPYTATIPLLYQINLTDPSQLLLNISQALPICPEDPRTGGNSFHEEGQFRFNGSQDGRYYDHQATCSLWTDLQDLHQQTWSIFRAEGEQLPTLHSRAKKGLTWLGEFYNWCCNLVTEDEVADFQVHDEQLAAHINGMKQLMHQDHANLVVTEQTFNNLTHSLNEGLQRAHSAVQTISQHLQADQRKLVTFEQQTLLHLYYTYLNNYINAYYSHYHRITSVCNNHKIAQSIIPGTILQGDLQSLTQRLTAHDYELAISLEDIQKYYSLPLAECTRFQSTVLVKVKIPIRPKTPRYTAYRIWALEYFWNDLLCSLTQEDFLLVNNTKEIQAASVNNWDEVKLIKLDRHKNYPTLNQQCMVTTLNPSSFEELRQVCQFNCRPADKFIRIRRIQEHEYLVSNVQPHTYIICNDESQELPAASVGVIWISMPCNCQLMDNVTTFIRPSFPCDNRHPTTLEIHHLVPHIWTSFKNVSLNHFQFIDLTDDLTNVIHNDWNVSFPTVKFQNNVSEAVLEEIVLKHNSDLKVENVMFISNKMILVWLSVLTAILIYNLVITKITSLLLRQPSQPVILNRHD